MCFLKESAMKQQLKRLKYFVMSPKILILKVLKNKMRYDKALISHHSSFFCIKKGVFLFEVFFFDKLRIVLSFES